jgi:nicotinamidase-related amidase
MSKDALLVIDMLNDFVLEGAPLEVPDNRKIIPKIKTCIGNFRQDHCPVIYVCDHHYQDDKEFSRMGWPPHALIGSGGEKVIDELSPLRNEVVIHKNTYSGFYETNLYTALLKQGITDLIVTGCVTNICILYTVADAVQRGFKVTVPENCVAALSEVDHGFALRQMETVLGATVL